MKTTRAQKKAELQASSEEIIECLLDWEEQNQAAKLTAIEEEILQLRKQFGVEMLRVVIEGDEARQPVANPTCKGCGQAMRYKGKKARDVVSRVGEVAIERGHYYCKDCASGFFPLDQQLELGSKPWSAGVEREDLNLSKIEAFKLLNHSVRVLSTHRVLKYRCLF